MKTFTFATTLLVLALGVAARATDYEVTSGTTSVAFNPSALKAAGLTITETALTVPPVSRAFQYGFAIFPPFGGLGTDGFKFSTANGFTPLSGEIDHLGTLEFNNDLTVGDFAIAYDPSTKNGQDSGFVLRDGLSGLTLFDFSAPKVVLAPEVHALGLQDISLFVAPDFADLLGKPELTGVDFGSAETDAILGVVPVPETSPLALIGAFAVGTVCVSPARRVLARIRAAS